MLALATLKVPSLLGVPVTATVCPTWSLKAALLFDCNCHALPLLSVRVKLSPEPLIQPCIVCWLEVAPVEVWSLAEGEDEDGVDCVEEGCWPGMVLVWLPWLDGWDDVLGWLLLPVWSLLLVDCAATIPADSSRIEMPYKSLVIDATPRLSSALNFLSSRRPGEDLKPVIQRVRKE